MKLISVNIERSKHLDRVLPFLQNEQPDVVCLQELMEVDIPRFTDALGMGCAYAPSCVFAHPKREEASGVVGIAVLSRDMTMVRRDYYVGTEVAARAEPATYIFTNNAVLSIQMGRTTVATTHFPWTPDGTANDAQRSALPRLCALLEQRGEFVLSGDFNAPRGTEIFTELAARYRDNIPAEYTTSIDKELHRAGDLQLMVDGLFTTPGVMATDVRLVSGVSDHMAIVANIQRG